MVSLLLAAESDRQLLSHLPHPKMINGSLGSARTMSKLDLHPLKYHGSDFRTHVYALAKVLMGPEKLVDVLGTAWFGIPGVEGLHGSTRHC